MKLPIDTSVLTFMCSLAPRPVINGQTKLPKADADGQPLHSVELASFGPEGAQVLVVKFPGSPPAGVIPGASVKVTNLMVSDWDIDGRHGLSFRAGKVEAVNGHAPKGGGAA